MSMTVKHARKIAHLSDDKALLLDQTTRVLWRGFGKDAGGAEFELAQEIFAKLGVRDLHTLKHILTSLQAPPVQL